MRSDPTPRRLGRATVLTGFAGLAIVAGGAGIAAATTGDDAPADAGYGVVVDAPTGAAAAAADDCPWDDDTAATSLAGAR